MNIIHVIETLGRGGAEQALVNLLPELSRRGHTTEVVVLWGPYDLEPQLQSAGIRVHSLDLRHQWSVIRGMNELRRVIEGGTYDVVHTHLFFADLYGALSKSVQGAPRIATFHNLAFDRYPARTPWRRARKAAYAHLMRRSFEAFIGVSHSVADHYRDHLELPHVEVIPNAFPLDRLVRRPELQRAEVLRMYGVEPGCDVVLVPGRLVPEKGHRYLLDALPLLSARGWSPVVLCFGSGPLRKELDREVAARGLDSQVRIFDAVPHDGLMEVMQAADIVVLPSVSEGLPLAPAEASALEVPVVATSVGGLPEVIKHEKTGLLVPSKNPQALASALEQLLADPALRAKMGRAGREHVAAMFSVESVADQLESVYERVCRKPVVTS